MAPQGEAQEFGPMAAEKQEQADDLAAKGIDPTDEPEGSGQDPRPRAGGKASDGAPPDAGEDTDTDAGVDDESGQSFPASDPPANY